MSWAAWGPDPKTKTPRALARFARNAALPEAERHKYGYDDTGRRPSDYPYGGKQGKGRRAAR